MPSTAPLDSTPPLPPAPFCGIFISMTITQTVEIPADRRITLEVPREVPTGRIARFEFILLPVAKEAKSFKTTLKEIQELCKDIPVSVNSLREERRRDMETENAE